jgi:hypothetical protein
MQVNASKWVRPSNQETSREGGLGPALALESAAPSHHLCLWTPDREKRQRATTQRWWSRVVTVGVVSLVCGFGCRSEKEREISREVAAMAHLVNQLRDAPHNAKEEPLRAATAVHCKSPQACELQQVCVQAYRLHADAILLSVHASRSDTTPDVIRDVLARAERDLGVAKDGMERCVALQGELTREYKL